MIYSMPNFSYDIPKEEIDETKLKPLIEFLENFYNDIDPEPVELYDPWIDSQGNTQYEWGIYYKQGEVEVHVCADGYMEIYGLNNAEGAELEALNLLKYGGRIL